MSIASHIQQIKDYDVIAILPLRPILILKLQNTISNTVQLQLGWAEV